MGDAQRREMERAENERAEMEAIQTNRVVNVQEHEATRKESIRAKWWGIISTLLTAVLLGALGLIWQWGQTMTGLPPRMDNFEKVELPAMKLFREQEKTRHDQLREDIRLVNDQVRKLTEAADASNRNRWTFTDEERFIYMANGRGKFPLPLATEIKPAPTQ